MYPDAGRTHNTLAHAWGPHVRSRGLPGDVHFDEDDDWSNSNELFIVAVHELGHSFGLLHSTDRSSIMFPTYQHVTKLSLDDRQAVDYLYGELKISIGCHCCMLVLVECFFLYVIKKKQFEGRDE